MKKKKTIIPIKENWIKPIIIGILVAVIIQVLWGIGVPVGNWLQEIIFKITTFGLTSLSNSFYRNVARGFHEESSIWILFVVISLLWLIVNMQIHGGFTKKNKSEDINKVLEDKLEEYKKLPPEEAEVLIKKAWEEYDKNYEKEIRRVKWNRRFKISVKIAIIIFLFFQFSILLQRNHAITRFRQVFTITKVFMDEKEEELILSRFSAIQNKQDYLYVLDTLTQKLKEKQQELENKREESAFSSDFKDKTK